VAVDRKGPAWRTRQGPHRRRSRRGAPARRPRPSAGRRRHLPRPICHQHRISAECEACASRLHSTCRPVQLGGAACTSGSAGRRCRGSLPTALLDTGSVLRLATGCPAPHLGPSRRDRTRSPSSRHLLRPWPPGGVPRPAPSPRPNALPPGPSPPPPCQRSPRSSPRQARSGWVHAGLLKPAWCLSPCRAAGIQGQCPGCTLSAIQASRGLCAAPLPLLQASALTCPAPAACPWCSHAGASVASPSFCAVARGPARSRGQCSCLQESGLGRARRSAYTRLGAPSWFGRCWVRRKCRRWAGVTREAAQAGRGLRRVQRFALQWQPSALQAQQRPYLLLKSSERINAAVPLLHTRGDLPNARSLVALACQQTRTSLCTKRRTSTRATRG